MSWKHQYGILFFFLFVGISSADIIVPAPKLSVESVTSYTIKLNWTMPTNELYDGFTVEIFYMSRRIRVFQINATSVTVERLTPGFFYSFIVRAFRGKLESDNSNILQDTVPLPPTNLRLETFDELVVTIDGIFGEVTFSAPVPGIEAVWEGPVEGVCDCYLISITPADGKVAKDSKVETLKLSTGTTTERDFIELTPGKTYTVSIKSATCSHGFLRPLMSDPLNATTTLPPASPPVAKVERVTETNAYITWKGLIPGYFDDFQLKLITGTEADIAVEVPDDPRTQARNVTGLKPCGTYGFEIFTLNKNVSSSGSQSVEAYTRPTPPIHLEVTDFAESFISVKWRYPYEQDIRGFEVAIENVMTLMLPAKAREATMEHMRPGTIHTLSVTAHCSGPGKIASDPAQVIQVTVPIPPKIISPTCAIITDTRNNDPYSQISLKWVNPQFGDWDGFVLYYSPFVFDNNLSNPQPPVLLSRGKSEINITIPTTGRIFTGQIRSSKETVLSPAETFDITCPNRAGEASRKCVVPPLKWNIAITEINATSLFVEVTELPLKNITITFCGNCDIAPLVTISYKFFTLNPCSLSDKSSPELVVTIYPACEQGLPCAPVRRKRLCPKPRPPVIKPDPGVSEEPPTVTPPAPMSPNACCNGRSYHKSFLKCCHGRLKTLDETNLLCCYTKWYDRRSHKCCGENFGEGVVKPSSVDCI